MKVLVIGSHILPDPTKQSQVDHWRMGRPMTELAKHVDWQIDHAPTYIQTMDKYDKDKEFSKQEMEAAFERICEYDIVYSSYHPDPTAYTLLKVARDRAGVQFVLDCDDDMFAINPDNPFWMKIRDEQVYWMQRMLADNDWVTTPSPVLAARFRKRREGHHPDSVTVIPNYISDDYKHPKLKNDPDIVIGYFGGSSHYADLHESGALPAIQKLMHENKKVRFKSVGMLVDHYIPRGRLTFESGERGTKWLTDVFPSLKMDIAIGPLLPNLFNEGKSNIKWQEATRAGAAFVASNVGPYQKLKRAELVENTTDSWYRVLKQLVDSPRGRKGMVLRAQVELQEDWRLEDHWQAYKTLFERVARRKAAHADTGRTRPVVRQP